MGMKEEDFEELKLLAGEEADRVNGETDEGAEDDEDEEDEDDEDEDDEE